MSVEAQRRYTPGASGANKIIRKERQDRLEALYSKLSWRFSRLMRRGDTVESLRVERQRVERQPRELQAASDAVKMKAYHTWLNMLSGFQLQEIKEAFKKFDRDGNGYIDASELFTTLQMLGSSATHEQVLDMIRSVDVDGSGTVEFEEFLVIMARRIITTEGEMELEQALLLFKPDESGRVPCVEIRTMLGGYGEQPLEPDELEELLRLADPGGTGYCTVEALRSLPCWRLPIPADSGPS
jgi:calmodulin